MGPQEEGKKLNHIRQVNVCYFHKNVIFHSFLPVTADVVRHPSLGEVAGELVDGKKPSKHNVSRQIEKIGRDILKPFRITCKAAQSKRPEQNQQGGRCSHDADKLEMETRIMRTMCMCVSLSGNIVVCKPTSKPQSEVV